MKPFKPIQFAALSLAALIVGAGYAQTPGYPSSASTSGDMGSTSARPDADNTRMNRRDRGGNSTTPGDQPENRGDLQIEAAVRRAIVHEKSLSTDAHNIKIVARSGVITLRGPVRSDAEKETVVSIAQQVSGVTQVDNQLDVSHP